MQELFVLIVESYLAFLLSLIISVTRLLESSNIIRDGYYKIFNVLLLSLIFIFIKMSLSPFIFSTDVVI